ncbi:hypothetical protein [Streptomyces rochei]|uniref:hypothetical protein n=1 Tax=Streptomyces rochei TaxID=1928 RepID=UPI0036D09639
MTDQTTEPHFGSPDCTCIPYTRKYGTPRYCGPNETVDDISGWERGTDCPHHAPAAPLPPAGQTTPLRDRIAEAALTAVEAALGDTLVPAARAEALAGIAAVLPADQTAGFDPQARILGLENELERMRHLLRSQNQRANAATARKEAAEQAPPIDVTTLAPLFEGFARLLSTSSRDWGQYAPDAWLYAVICGWDCEETTHSKSCVHGAMEEMAERHGWDDATVAKARRYRATVRAITEGAAVLPAPADRAAVLDEAADHAEIVALRLRLKHDYGAANGAFEVMAELRRHAAETPAAECGECGHPKAVHREGDDPVTPGQCADCPEDEDRHDYRAAGARQDGAQR